jgi:signal peptidase I
LHKGTIEGYNMAMTEPPSPSPVSLTSFHLFADLCEELLRQGRSVRFRAPGRSMYPTIRENDVITVEPIGPLCVRVGDIVLYSLQRGVVAHRVVRMIQHDRPLPAHISFVLKGDTWRIEDEPLQEHQILGKVVTVERKGRPSSPYTKRAKMRRLIHVIGSSLKRIAAGC